MPKPELQISRRRDAHAEYSYRRQLGLRQLIPAIGIGIGAGLFAFYITRLLLQRTPLRVTRGPQVATKPQGRPTRNPRGERPGPGLGHPAA